MTTAQQPQPTSNIVMPVDNGRRVTCDQIDPHPGIDVRSFTMGDERIGIDHTCPPQPPAMSPVLRPDPFQDLEPRNGLETSLLSGPARVHGLEEALWNTQRIKQRLQERLDFIEAEMKGKIATATGDDGKPRFRNEDQRQGQLMETLLSHGEYQNVRDQLRAQDEVVAKLERDLRRTELEMRNARSLILGRARLRMEVDFQ